MEAEDTGKVIECYCRSCQSYHAAASVHYVFAHAVRVVNLDDRDVATLPIEESSRLMDTYQSRCEYFSSLPILRSFCRRCFSRLYSVQDNHTSKKDRERQPFMVNLGSFVDKTIPIEIFQSLSIGDIFQWKPAQLPYWAKPEGNNGDDSSSSCLGEASQSQHRGKCHCGACRYEFTAPRQTEVQHCYCALCRRHSGSLYTSWIPIQTLTQALRWTVQESALTTRRPTDSSRRFFCSTCGTCMAIVYDWEETDDPETAWIWVSGGCLDNTNPTLRLERRAHIYCRYKPRWYTIPDDDLSQCSE